MRPLRYDGARSLRALYVRRRILNSILNLTVCNRMFKTSLNVLTSLLTACVYVCVLQGYTRFLQPTDFAVAVQHGLFLLNEALGPSVWLQRHYVCFALSGGLPDLLWRWEDNGEAAAFSLPNNKNVLEQEGYKHCTGSVRSVVKSNSCRIKVCFQ